MRGVARLGVAAVTVAGLLPVSAGAVARPSGYCTAPSDTVPPAITGVSLSARSVHISKSPQTVHVVVHADDKSVGAPSGVRFVKVEADGPRDEQVLHLSLTRGTPAKGVWSGTIRLTKHSNSGGWYLRLFEIVDRSGNGVYYIRNTDAAPDDVYDPRLQPGWQQTFSVSGTPHSPPYRPGSPTMLKLTPPAVNTTRHAKSIHVTTAFAGPRPRRVQFELRGHVNGGRYFFVRTHLSRTGSRWTGTVPIRRWAGRTTAHVLMIPKYHHNVRPNYKFFYARDLRALGLPDSVSISSRHDTAKPKLTGFSFTPTSVDTRTESRLVHIMANASDRESGPNAVDVRFFRRAPRTVFHDKTTGMSDEPFVRLVRHGLTWSGSLTIPGCVEGGRWKAGVYVQDRSGRHRDYTRKDLEAAGLPAVLKVTSKFRDTTPPQITQATSSAVDHTISLTFSQGVLNVSTSTLTLYPHRPARTRYQEQADISAISCRHDTTPVDCSGSDATVTSAILDVPSISAGIAYEVWANLHQATPQLANPRGYPIDPEYGPQRTTGKA